MGLFDMDDNKLMALYHRAWLESGRGWVDPAQYPYLEHAIFQYMQETGCTKDEATVLAKTGKRTGSLEKLI